MAIQAQLFPSNAGTPFWDNGYCAGGLVESCFNSQQKHQQQQLQQCWHQLHNVSQRPFDPNLLVYNSKANNATNIYNNHHSTSNSPSLAIQIEKQMEEIDQYIRLQNEQLRFMLQEQGKQQVAALLKKLESRSLHMLREKDEEIAQAEKRRIELEDFLRKLEAENQEWQKVARENEAVALSLYKTLEETKERASYGFNNGVVADDAESCCEEKAEERVAENGVVGGGGGVGEFEQITREMMLCKSCHSRTSCYLFLPCRHLSSCKACEAFLDACPVCRMEKKNSIETLIF